MSSPESRNIANVDVDAKVVARSTVGAQVGRRFAESRTRRDFLSQGGFRHEFRSPEPEPQRRAIRTDCAFDWLAVAAEAVRQGNSTLARAQHFELTRLGKRIRARRPCNEHLSPSRNQVNSAPDCPPAARPSCDGALGGAA